MREIRARLGLHQVGLGLRQAGIQPNHLPCPIGRLAGAIRAARDFMGRYQGFKGYHFWARGYFVSTVGIDERTIREYIRDQEKNDQKLDQQRLF